MQKQSGQKRVFVIGNGLTKFLRPGKHNYEYYDLATIAINRALDDAKISKDEIEKVYACYVYGDSCTGQKSVYSAGILTGVPIINVNNNCSTGSSGLYLAHNDIRGGLNECALVAGFEKMFTGSLRSFFPDRENPTTAIFFKNQEIRGVQKGPMAPIWFGNAGREHMEKYGTKLEHFAMVAAKNKQHGVNNPYSQFRKPYTVDQVMKSPMIHEPLTFLQCCPTSDGAGAAILCSEDFMIKHNLQDQAIEITGIDMTTDTPSSYDTKSSINLIGGDMAKRCAEKVYKQIGINFEKAGDHFDVVELHDCFSANELCTYEAIGLCPVGTAGQAIERGDFTYGGKAIVNPSGGLISKGHPLGATGLAQCAELCWQLKNAADLRQVKNCKNALQHNLGLGGACVVAAYQKYNNNPPKIQTSDPEKLDDYEKIEVSQLRQRFNPLPRM